jgi:NADPH:quinone reductase
MPSPGRSRCRTARSKPVIRGSSTHPVYAAAYARIFKASTDFAAEPDRSDAVINGQTGDILAAAQRFAPHGVDAVLGLTGGDALERCIDTLRRDGRGRVAYMYGMEPIPKPRFGVRMILYSFISGIHEFERLNKAVEAAKLQVPVGAEYSLADAAEAHRRLEAGHVLGKIVLHVQ